MVADRNAVKMNFMVRLVGLGLLTVASFAPRVDSSGAAEIEPKAYLQDALGFIERNALRRDQVDWDLLDLQIVAMIGQVEASRDTYPAIRLAIEQLRDRHSTFLEPEEVALRGAGRATAHSGLRTLDPKQVVVQVYTGGPAARAGVRVGDVVESEESIGTDGSTLELTLRRPGQGSRRVRVEPATVNLNESPTGRRLAGGLAYLELPGHTGYGQAAVNGYATRTQRLIKALDEGEDEGEDEDGGGDQGVCGWIVDLRRNSGGNMWPMLAGVGPLLGEGELGAFVSRRGKRAWRYADGKAFLDGGSVSAKVEGEPYRGRRPGTPVAVLTSGFTGSSGEAVLIAFRGRPATRSFGEPTYGVPTANTVKLLPDGAQIILTVARDADRTGRIYDDKIAPEERVSVDWTRFGQDDDPVTLAAASWLLAQRACRTQVADASPGRP